MKKIIPIATYLSGLILFLLIFNIFAPLNSTELSQIEIDPVAIALIRFFSSFCYSSSINQYWIMVGASIFLSIAILISLGLFEIRIMTFKLVKSTFFVILGIHSLFPYFYWILVRNITENLQLQNDLILENFLSYTLLHICLEFVIGGLIVFSVKFLQMKYQKEQEHIQFITVYQCPRCKTDYYSKVHYCSRCHIEIEVLSKKITI
ncbi:MAG: hypothetical protein K9W44_05825 [Candidatus Lokiarchaeota archaeon]|nr:hypothetical protein [Candidatus Harpocratesius repetitus]